MTPFQQWGFAIGYVPAPAHLKHGCSYVEGTPCGTCGRTWKVRGTDACSACGSTRLRNPPRPKAQQAQAVR